MIANASEKPGACDSCRFETEELEAYRIGQPSSFHNKSHKWLCFLCASTPAGMAYEYPDQFRGQQSTLETVCYGVNAILAELRRASKGSE